MAASKRPRPPEDPRGGEGVPRWPAIVALLLIGLFYAEISAHLKLGPSSLLPGVVVVALLLIIPTYLRGYYRLTRLLGLGTIAVVTVALTISVFLLVGQLLFQRQVAASALLRDAGLSWIINVVTFAVWYWEIDGGGPAQRRRDAHASEDFLFPQMSRDERASSNWSPGFVDYLFLAFNTSTAFSPTDTAVLSKRAKVLTMIQSLLSLMVIAVLAARAINTL